MDIELARTFVEIVSTRSFIKAAERLNFAQTTVSARVRNLEQQLGRPLFIRNKGGAFLTPAGKQFLRHAPTFIQLWQRTLQQVRVPSGKRAVLTVGSEISLANPLLLDWVRWMRQSLQDIALRVHVDVPRDLVNQVSAGMVDVAIMYSPKHQPGLQIDLLLEEKLVLVTTDLEAYALKRTDYVYTDWGADFMLHHGLGFPDLAPDLFIDLGPLALSYILSTGGSGYFRMSVVEPHITAGRLFLVPDAPQFSYPVYAVRSVNADESVVDAALAGLHAVADG
jgi:DNA-binding transcriptional LysR family regulator